MSLPFNMITPVEIGAVSRSYLPEPHASLLNGILLGIPLKGTGQFYQDVMTAGLIHLVVISGTNISMIMNPLFSTRKLVGKQLSFITTVVFLVLFVMFVGIAPPVFRALVMNVIILLGLITGKQTHALYILLVTALISLVTMPNWVSSLSFVLTYAATTSLILFGKPIMTMPKQATLATKVCITFLNELKASAGAHVLIAPVLYIYFGRLSFSSIITTPLVSWTIFPIMVCGSLMIAMSAVSPPLAYLLSVVTKLLLDVIVVVVEMFS